MIGFPWNNRVKHGEMKITLPADPDRGLAFPMVIKVDRTWLATQLIMHHDWSVGSIIATDIAEKARARIEVDYVLAARIDQHFKP